MRDISDKLQRKGAPSGLTPFGPGGALAERQILTLADH